MEMKVFPPKNVMRYVTIDETEFDLKGSLNWMRDYWSLSIVSVLLYVLLIALGKRWMETRESFRLQESLTVWNMILAAFSFYGFFRTLPELFNVLNGENGLHNSICSREKMTIVTIYWTWLGTLSKLFELGDTIFIILRKQPLIFLHWYHHATVLLYTWYTYESIDPVHGWFMVMNYFVHSIMYTYYVFRASGVRFHKRFAKCITSVQLIQMVIGVSTTLYSIYAKSTDMACDRETKNVGLSFLMYASYFLLFARFYKTKY